VTARLVVLATLVAVGLGLPPSAFAGDAGLAADRAAEALRDHCRPGRGPASPARVALVGEIWGRTTAAYEASSARYLLYWRGMLADCVDQDARAGEDLALFLAAHKQTPALRDLVGRARLRLRRLPVDPVVASAVAPWTGGEVDFGEARLLLVRRRGRRGTGIALGLTAAAAGTALGLAIAALETGGRLDGARADGLDAWERGDMSAFFVARTEAVEVAQTVDRLRVGAGVAGGVAAAGVVLTVSFGAAWRHDLALHGLVPVRSGAAARRRSGRSTGASGQAQTQ
jgi:hypothetical protein